MVKWLYSESTSGASLQGFCMHYFFGFYADTKVVEELELYSFIIGRNQRKLPMGGLIPVILIVILSVCPINALSLGDLYPFGTDNGDATETGASPLTISLVSPIDNLVEFGPHQIAAASYVVRTGYLQIKNDDSDNFLYVYLAFIGAAGSNANNVFYGRTTSDPVLIKRAMDQINKAFPYTFCSASPPTQLLISTWINFKKSTIQEGSNFQLVIVTNGNITFGIALFVDVHIPIATTGITSNINGMTNRFNLSLFPFGRNVINAPNMTLNSDTPGTYIFPLSDMTSNTTCSVCFTCKDQMLAIICEALKRTEDDLPAPCKNFT
ncbi:PREDICTED: uncharacterized protein LOC100637633 [Amphimedon queenslandica]|uniref:NIDO domain-containing protein n=2 Tax=Amphimedon queenslandica TaxID=400682 RepID=A0AAN0J5A7_AMPQE|nr:PREDICTED: uncharacterized protein LOC100637633 [Amphimedon queenslandica]|eukprot:XP_019851932.1 PREDICTED: uncharacterized protein LOC100637633 [Amphimedon queenslandica]